MGPYTRRQLALLLLLLAAVGVGLAIGRWRRAHPELAETLERLDHTPASPSAAESVGDRGGERPPTASP